MMIAGMDKTILSLSYVKNAINQEDMKREKDEKEEDKAMALAARRNKKHKDTEGHSRGYQQGRKRQDEDYHQEEKKEYFCFACGGRNHVAKYCKKKHSSSRQPDPRRRYKKEEPSRRDENRHQEERHRHENKSQRESATLARAKEEERECRAICVKKGREEEGKHVWLLDSGATNHMSPYKDLFEELHDYSGVVDVADGEPLQLKGRGNVVLKVDKRCGTFDIKLTKMYSMYLF